MLRASCVRRRAPESGTVHLGVWISFIAAVLILLALDLGVFHRKDSVPTVKDALRWTAFYVALAGAFTVFVYFLYEGRLGLKPPGMLSGEQAALQFITGYLIEESLSADNIFVIAVIFGYFRVPPAYQHRVLFWGILGAIAMRGIMIALGAALIHQFSWITYVFGALLVVTAIRLYMSGDDDFDPESNFLAKLMRRFYPVTSHFDGQKFFTFIGSRRAMTPLFITLLVVESSDVLFAIDSIPAIFAITTDPFLVFTSLVILLGFIGVKMLIAHHFPIPTGISLGIVAAILAIGIGASMWSARKAAPAE